VTPIAAKPVGSHASQCQAWAWGLVVVTVLLSSRPQAVTTWSTARGDASVAMVRNV